MCRILIGMLVLAAMGCASSSCKDRSDLLDLDREIDPVAGMLMTGGLTQPVAYCNMPVPVRVRNDVAFGYNMVLIGSDRDIVVRANNTAVLDARLFDTAVLITDKGIEVVGKAVNITKDADGRICIDPAP
jgi:hypothetical protein